jgi:hypothetical protein
MAIGRERTSIETGWRLRERLIFVRRTKGLYVFSSSRILQL